MALGSLMLICPVCAGALRGYGSAGIFASLAYLGTSATVVVNALGQSASARLARMFADLDLSGFFHG